jgi:molybdenum cofactor synthesis domain-containing protein
MELISLAESLRIVSELASTLHSSAETISARSALGRVLAAPVFAKKMNPAEAIAAMDGIALDFRSAMTPSARIKAGKWQRINTGERVPAPFNSVVKIEDLAWDGETPIVATPVRFSQHVRHPGEDFQTGALLFLAGHVLGSPDLSLLLAGGNEEVTVRKKALVTFIPTGSELVLNSADAAAGKILESNSAMIKGMVEIWGAEFQLSDPVPDDPDDLAQTIKLAISSSNLILVSAGTSMGTRDNTAGVLRVMGKVHFHGVDVSPAKPVLLGEVGNVPVLGLPGYPAAAFVASHLYLRPLVRAFSGIDATLPQGLFISAEEIAARKTETFHRVQLFEVDEHAYVRRIPKGAGSILSLSEMDGLMRVPANTPIRKRDAVRVDLLRQPQRNVFAGGGVPDHDISHLFDVFRAQVPDHRLLFWETPVEEALQNIIERNAHFAIINTPLSGPDFFPQFSKQLQEPMQRIRIFTRKVGLIISNTGDFKEMPRPLDVALPARNTRLWEQLLEEQKWMLQDFQTILVECEEEVLPESLHSGQWQAIFIDLRFLKDSEHAVETTEEHIDLVASENLLSTTPLKQLAELLTTSTPGHQGNLQI